ncbi:hypothetical protein CA51_30370 [Rosistilla oblonga]|uniref:Uncharacterized protein n=1 Tax=Rosistilla oblonga TaxID=2527990 RepID=A0A518IZZ3_9BACT|nr:hypothetical protein [Rosistilla oblonga]QDV13150.1 hypothetical protein CA51_30370 [Rosistilla oblonga]QDV58663.1 hypothetical protein Mal33_46870 [Rosistilla oblonga]
MLIRTLLIAVSIACLHSAAIARDLVIDNVSGSDYQNDRGLVAGSPSFGPYRTIMRALLVAQPGDSIVLTKTGVPYRECISLNGRNHSGSPSYPFRIVGNGAVLDGSTTPRPDGWEIVNGNLYRYIPPRPGYGQLMLAGRALPRFVSPDGDLSSMPGGEWAHQNGRIFYRPPAGKSPLDEALEITSEAVGITLYDVEHVVITDLTIRGYRLDGINAHDKANEVQLIGIAARHNGRSGISVGGSSSVTIGASLCELNGVAQLRTEGQSHTYLANVDLAEGVGTPLANEGGNVLRLPKE